MITESNRMKTSKMFVFSAFPLWAKWNWNYFNRISISMHFEMCTSNACHCVINNNFAFNYAYTRSGEKSANSLYLIIRCNARVFHFFLIWSCRFTKAVWEITTREGLIFVALRLSIFTFHRVVHTHPSTSTLDTNNNDKPDTRVRQRGVSDSALRLLLSLDATRSMGPWNQLHHRHHCNAGTSWNAVFHYYLNTSTDTEMES